MGEKKSSGRKNRNTASRRRWLIGGLAVFLLFDLGLVAFALTTTKSPRGAGTIALAPSASPTPVVEPSETPSDKPTVEPTAAPMATVTPTRILAVLNSSTAWRASTGACPATKAAPELTTDSGATWQGFDASAETDASSILAINIVDKNETSLVTLDAANCAPQLVSTFVSGDAWKAYPERAANTWYVDPSTSGTVHSPTGDKPAPCSAVVSLAASGGANSAILCADGTLSTTSDAGSTWSPLVPVPGAAAVAVTADGFVLAIVNPTGCVGVSLGEVSREGVLASRQTACLPATINPGETAISAQAGSVWVWAGDAFGVSMDGGVTWG